MMHCTQEHGRFILQHQEVLLKHKRSGGVKTVADQPEAILYLQKFYAEVTQHAHI